MDQLKQDPTNLIDPNAELPGLVDNPKFTDDIAGKLAKDIIKQANSKNNRDNIATKLGGIAKELKDKEIDDLKKAIKDLALQDQINDPLTDLNIGDNNPDNKKEIIPEKFPTDDVDASNVLNRIDPAILSPILKNLKDLDRKQKDAEKIGLTVLDLKGDQKKNRKLIKDAIDGALKEYEKEELLKKKKQAKDALKKAPFLIDVDKDGLKPLFNGSKDDDEDGGAIVAAITDNSDWLKNKDITDIPEKAINKVVDDNGDEIIKKLKDTIAGKAKDEMDDVDPTFDRKLGDKEKDNDLLKDALSDEGIDIKKDLDECLGLLEDDKKKAKELAKFVLKNSPDDNVAEVAKVLAELKLGLDQKREEDRKKAEEEAIKVIKDKGGRKPPEGELPNLVVAPKFTDDSGKEGFPIDLLVKAYKLPIESLQAINNNNGKDKDKFIPDDISKPRLKKLKDDLLELEKKFAELNKITIIDDAFKDDSELEKGKESSNNPKKKLEKEIKDLLKAKLAKAQKEAEEDKKDPKSEPKKPDDLKKPEDKDDESKIPKDKIPVDGVDYYMLGEFHQKIETDRVNPDEKGEIYFCYVQEPGDISDYPDTDLNNKIPEGWRRNPHLVTNFSENVGKKRVVDAALSGTDFDLSYRKNQRPNDENIQKAARSLREGYFFEKAIGSQILDKSDTIIRNLELSAGENWYNSNPKYKLNDIKEFICEGHPPIPVKFDNKGKGRVASANVLEKSDDGRKAKLAFIVPEDNVWPDDFLNIRYVHIPGTGEVDRSLKVKIELVRKNNTEIDGVKYNRGDIVIHKNPYEMRENNFIELTKKGKNQNQYTDKEMELMKEMKISCTLLHGDKEGHVTLKKMAVMDNGRLFKTEIYNIDALKTEEARLVYKDRKISLGDKKIPSILDPTLSYHRPGNKNDINSIEDITNDISKIKDIGEQNKITELKRKILSGDEKFKYFEEGKFFDKEQNPDKSIEFDLAECSEGLIKFAFAQMKAKKFNIGELKLTNIDKADPKIIKCLTESWKGIKIEELELDISQGVDQVKVLPNFKERKDKANQDIYSRISPIKDALGDADCLVGEAKFNKKIGGDKGEYDKQLSRAIQITRPINVVHNNKAEGQILDLSKVDSKELGREQVKKKLMKLAHKVDILGKLKEIKISSDDINDDEVDQDNKHLKLEGDTMIIKQPSLSFKPTAVQKLILPKYTGKSVDQH